MRIRFLSIVLMWGTVFTVLAEGSVPDASGDWRSAALAHHRSIRSGLFAIQNVPNPALTPVSFAPGTRRALGSVTGNPVPRYPGALLRGDPGETFPSITDDHLIVAYYGNPFSTKMGILGEYPLDDVTTKVIDQAKEWERASGKPAIPAFHLIYATIWPDGTYGLLSDDMVLSYINKAAEYNMIVVLDHQLGVSSPVDCVRYMLPWLKFPNVHLAIDPEWRTSIPGKEIGTVDAEEINQAEAIMEDYLVRNDIKEKRMLIVHQFNRRQIANREKVRSDFSRVELVHNADGFGDPHLKIDTYAYIALATNMPVKGFKLFFPKPWKNEGYDIPMMSMEQVLALKPSPVFINYQ